ncbi:hypothetical protein [Microvirga massiliensis]|uniref:hypothetical protein n=1 Tax=Microvirga massiliensis TaxID=1033741 RepID=UPI00062B54D7|nr:hypothetical protein [Microvirga massiliensis]
MTDRKHEGMDRRAFMVSIGGVASAAAFVSPETDAKSGFGNTQHERSAGVYQPGSDHVKGFYLTNGYKTLKK